LKVTKKSLFSWIISYYFKESCTN